MKIIHGDCLEELKKLEDCSVDAIVTDPPYGLSNTKPAQVADVLAAWVTGDTEAVPAGKGFMGNDWDSFVPPPAVWEECLRVLKPGGHMAVFAGARTQDLMGLSIRLAGFEIRDSLAWIYGQGIVRGAKADKSMQRAGIDGSISKKFQGMSSALKPSLELIVLARKPILGTIVENALAYGTGYLNIDPCRYGPPSTSVGLKSAALERFNRDGKVWGTDGIGTSAKTIETWEVEESDYLGRFPANVLMDEHQAEYLDGESGILSNGYNDQPGGASRYFPVFKYHPKAPKRERPVLMQENGEKVFHPTVKPLGLMEWLVTLITPPGGVVLDPFAGTGTTLQAAKNKGFKVIGIEQDSDYIQLIHKRLNH